VSMVPRVRIAALEALRAGQEITVKELAEIAECSVSNAMRTLRQLTIQDPLVRWRLVDFRKYHGGSPARSYFRLDPEAADCRCVGMLAHNGRCTRCGAAREER